jgi:1,4-dihydroxy-2-naphthoate octaprenyltransferase
MSAEGRLVQMENPVATRRRFWTLVLLTWALAMLAGVVAVGLVVHANLGEFVFVGCVLTFAVAFWFWLLRRRMR